MKAPLDVKVPESVFSYICTNIQRGPHTGLTPTSETGSVDVTVIQNTGAANLLRTEYRESQSVSAALSREYFWQTAERAERKPGQLMFVNVRAFRVGVCIVCGVV